MARMVTKYRHDTCIYGARCCSDGSTHRQKRRTLKRRERQKWQAEVRLTRAERV